MSFKQLWSQTKSYRIRVAYVIGAIHKHWDKDETDERSSDIPKVQFGVLKNKKIFGEG